MKFLIVGGGAQGQYIARNLAARPQVSEVVIGDIRAPAPPVPFPPNCRTTRLDALDASDVARASRGVSAAVAALPGELGRRALVNLVAAGVPTVDIAFMRELPFDLDEAARQAGVPVVVDCGVAPGLSHILAAHVDRELGGLDDLRIFVGGIPLTPPPVFHHAVYFHVRDLLEEYVRPARIRKNGVTDAVDPLAAPAISLEDEETGPLEAFPSDGLRTLLGSFADAREMTEYTLRVPGHLETMRQLKSLGLLAQGPSVEGLAMALETTYPGYMHPDRLVMEVWGTRGARQSRYRLHALSENGVSAMARTTGATAAAASWLIATRRFTESGVHPPERLGRRESDAREILDDLRAHGHEILPSGRLRVIGGASPRA
ncbi:MAG: hypothetical protein HY556_03935 [Euryarchaeota archaeon]|nr:hypothetical protein [Euryarchaeota archaeon]